MDENRIKQQVIDSLDTIGINVYFIHFDLDEDPAPYYAYVFDESLVEEAREAFYDGYVIEGAYDDFAFDCDFEDSLCRDIVGAISYNYIKERSLSTDRGE
jgi:hypothetical protein